MKVTTRAGLASTILVGVIAAAVPVSAADFGGSVKDGYVPRMPVVHGGGGPGPCYFRADVGASISRDPDTTWPVYNTLTTIFTETNGGAPVVTGENFEQRFIGDDVVGIDFGNTWLAEVGLGCGSGSRGFRGDVTFGFRGNRDFRGVPRLFRADTVTENFDVPTGIITRTPGTPQDFDDPLNTSIRSYTLMFNAYYDFGRWGPIVPYVGAGVGAAYHIVDDVYFTGNPFLVNQIEGDRDLAFAWSVMGGMAYQLSQRAIIDVGYRYIDMGKAKSGRVDSAGFVNPRVVFDDIAAHEIKVGLRYHFGSSGNCCTYEPFK